jgi:hypothetical protein
VESRKPTEDHRQATKKTVLSTARRFASNKKVAVPVGIVALALVVYGVTGLLNSNSGASSSQHRAVNGPEYQTVLPGEKSVGDLGGWKRVSPPKNDPVYAYSDTINEIPISVSQQPLPKSFVGNVDDKVADLAQKFNANTKIDGGDTKVYIGTSAKGPQSVIFTKKNVLVLIKSEKKIDNDTWATYIKSLNFSQAGVPNY